MRRLVDIVEIMQNFPGQRKFARVRGFRLTAFPSTSGVAAAEGAKQISWEAWNCERGSSFTVGRHRWSRRLDPGGLQPMKAVAAYGIAVSGW
jgi:hypothetical protein